MMSKILILCAVLIATTAEPPVSSGYNYPAPQSQHHQQQQQILLPAVQAHQPSFQPQQQTSFQPQQQVPFQPQHQHQSSSSSQVLDGQLIGQIQNLIYQDEIRSIQQAYTGPSAQYGVPQIRVTGVALESARPSLEISQYSESAPAPTSYQTGSINLPAHSSGYNYPAPQVSTGSIQLPAVQPVVSSGYNYPAPQVRPVPAPAPLPIYKPAPAPVYQPAPAPTYQPAPAPVQHSVGQIISPSYQQTSSSGYNYPRPQPQQAPSAIYLPSHQHKPAPAPSTSYGVPF